MGRRIETARKESRTGRCPACASSEMWGMQLMPDRRGKLFWQPCPVCRGKEKIIPLATALRPDVMTMLLQPRKAS